MTWGSADDLLARIKAKERPLVFIVGSGLTVPFVPNTKGVVGLIEQELKGHERAGVHPLREALAAGGNQYQIAFDYLLRTCGPNAANHVIRRAVLSARKDPDSPRVRDAEGGDPEACADLDADVEGWRVPDGLAALGRIATRLAHPSCRVLTTNFDPLIDIAVRRAGGRAISIALAADGTPTAADQSQSVLIAQVHGDWRRADGLHTPDVLTSERPQLRAALRRLMSDRLVIVLGYAGWEDILTLAIKDLLHEESEVDLRWAFFESTQTAVEKRYVGLLARLKPGLGKRVFLHLGVDVNVFLPRLDQSLKGEPIIQHPIAPTSSREIAKARPATQVIAKRRPSIRERLTSVGRGLGASLGGVGKVVLIGLLLLLLPGLFALAAALPTKWVAEHGIEAMDGPVSVAKFFLVAGFGPCCLWVGALAIASNEGGGGCAVMFGIPMLDALVFGAPGLLTGSVFYLLGWSLMLSKTQYIWSGAILGVIAGLVTLIIFMIVRSHK